MANTGTKRSLTVEVTKYSNGVEVSSHTYYGQNPFTYGGTNYPTLSDEDLQTMSNTDFNIRLAAFKSYIELQESISDFDATIDPLYPPSIEDLVECNPSPTIAPFDSLFRNALIRNTALDNWNISGETRFRIVEVDLDNHRILLNNDIPQIVVDGTEQFGTDRGWAIMKDYQNGAWIQTVTVDSRWVYYDAGRSLFNTAPNAFAVNDYVTFFNPFMNYNLLSDTQLLPYGTTGTWNSIGIQMMGIWKTQAGKYRSMVYGTNAISGAVGRMGLAESDDLITWSYLNSGNYMYEPGVGDFAAYTGVFFYSNPLQIDTNEYLAFCAFGTAGGTKVGWIKFDEDFVITEVAASTLTMPGLDHYVQIPGGCVYYEGNYHLIFHDRVSSDVTTWKIYEAIIPDLDTMVVSNVYLVHEPEFVDRFDGYHTDLGIPIVYEDEMYVFIMGTGKQATPYSILVGNREVGLKKRNIDNTFTINTKSPILLNPIMGHIIWDGDFSTCTDHMGGGLGYYFDTDNDTLYMTLTFNMSSSSYKPYGVKISLNVIE